jgi:CheY-like chemotaxis protein
MPAQEIILLVNGVPDHAASFEHALIRHGFHVRLARSGKEAIAAARESLPEGALPPTVTLLLVLVAAIALPTLLIAEQEEQGEIGMLPIARGNFS